MRALKLPWEPLKQCVENTFQDKEHKSTSKNALLEQWAYEWHNLGHQVYPSLIINNKTFRGRLTPDNAFEAFCAAFKDEPAACRVW